MKKISNFSRVAETEYALSTDSINLLYYELPKDYCDEYKSYDAPRLCTILEGLKEVGVNQSNKFVYQKDKFVLLPSHSTVYMSIPEHTRALVYEFSDKIIDYVNQIVSDKLEINASKDIQNSTSALNEFTDRILCLHNRILNVISEKDVNMHFLINITCQEMVYELMRIKDGYNIIHYHMNHPINKSIRIMNSSNGHQMKISEIAEEVDMSLSNFSQKFKLATSQSPQEYITKLRLQRSKQYLKYLSVTESAYEVGYENISYYIRLFKKEYGITPKQYQLNETR